MPKIRPVASPGELQLADLLDHGKPGQVLAEAKRFFSASFPAKGFAPVARAFSLTLRLFEGAFPGYGPCDTDYHNLRHTLQVFSAAVRLMDGATLSERALSGSLAAELLVAALLHDAGYIRRVDEEGGTGAKYTKVHVERSAQFVRDEAQAFGLDEARAQRISLLILGTDLARPWPPALASAEELFAAAILASADLLGQMADRAYLERLLFLYYEFREAGIGDYKTTFDVLRKTADFYGTVKTRLDGPLGSAAGLALVHFRERYGLPRDLYREAIGRQMVYLDSIIADDSTNFRRKLKRLDLAAIEREHTA